MIYDKMVKEEPNCNGDFSNDSTVIIEVRKEFQETILLFSGM
jgi:hypothetical protein